jgi:hypothetical protein
MTRRTRPLVAVTALALALMAPAAAQASAASSEALYHVETRSANGYRVVIDARGSTLVLGVIRDEGSRRSGAATYYVARAKTRGGRIRSRIGNLGSVSMAFHPTGSGRLNQADCYSSGTWSRPGAFVGSLSFVGEGGYVKLSAHRLRGAELRNASRCKLSAASRIEAKAKVTRLFAGFRSGLDATYLSARTAAHVGSVYEVETETGGSEYAVRRFAYAYAPAHTFRAGGSLAFANVTPPYPFSGTGSLGRAADGAPIWSGSLAVSFPGAEETPLTGPSFKVRLARSW